MKNKKPKAKQELIWTKDAINCYELNSDCTKCLLSKILETPCLMNLTVEKNLKSIGKPTFINTQKERKPHAKYSVYPTAEEIMNALATKGKKDVAKQFNTSLYVISNLMKKYSINGNFIRGERQRNKK